MSEITLEDRLAIDALVTEYAYRLDHSQWDRIGDLFTVDAYLKIRGREILGRDGLADWARARAAKSARKTQHQMTNLHLEATEDPDRVHGVAALVLHVAKSGGNDTYIDLVGEYNDEYSRQPDGWRFSRRVLVPVGDL